MSRMLMTVALVVFGVSAVQAATLDISIAAQGAGYDTMVRDAKLRGDGIAPNNTPYDDWNLGAASGGSQRFYNNFLADGTTSSGRSNNIIQRFDVSSIPPGSTINSAILTVYLANQTASNRTFTNAHLSKLQPGMDWVETYEAPPGGPGPHFDGSVTWNRRVSYNTDPPGIRWAGPGGTGAADIDLGTTKTFDLVGVLGQATTNVQDITSWVQYWVNTPANNTGMLWWGGNYMNGGQFFYFGVKEDGVGPANASVAAAPTLVIDYTPASAISPFTLINPSRSNDTFSVSFATQSGATYKLQYKDSVSGATWTDGASTPGDGSVKTLTDITTLDSRFYRVSAQ